MSFWEVFALVLTGAGTFASILGIFFAIYARQNGRETREFIAKQINFLAEKMDEGFRRTGEKIDEGLRKIGEKMDEVFRKIGEKTDESFRLIAMLILAETTEERKEIAKRILQK